MPPQQRGPLSDPVSVASYSYVTEAESARLALEQRSIATELRNWGIATAHPFLSNAVGGVQVCVERENASEAKQILEGLVADREPDTDASCPMCDSRDIEETPLTGNSLLVGLLTLGISLTFHRRHTCRACGHKW